ncbi:MAG: MFS transporter [Allosphingosinicella sp.]|uniref:MFS transporter n=1 Tax=Allosphingosinicella sp. TaxID=2823234 RepID=UPI00395962EF
MSTAADAEGARPAEGAGRIWPSAGTAWFMVGMLTIAYVFSFVDRYILGLLIQPIKADLGLTDEQIGWVLGPAFAIFYATMGLPMGWLADRKRRTWIIAAGVAVWSLATAASGLARNFWHLFFARMTVGVGEATLSPAAFSMIGDSFPPERRGKPIAVYSTALTLGAGIASLIGAGVLAWAKSAPEIVLPGIGPVLPWQFTFFAVGLPGLLVAIVFVFMREPIRQTALSADPDLRGNGMGDMLRYVGGRWGTYLSFVSLICVMTIVAYSQGFLPATFERTWGWAPETYAFYNGLALLIIGPVSVYAMGVLSDRLMSRGITDAPLRIIFGASLLLVPTGSIAMFMPTGWGAFAILCLNTAAIAGVSAVGVTALLNITPAQIRGQVVALYYMAISLAGLLLGPTTVGILSTRVFGEENIRYAVATLPILYGIVPLLIIPVTWRLYRAQMDRLGTASA